MSVKRVVSWLALVPVMAAVLVAVSTHRERLPTPMQHHIVNLENLALELQGKLPPQVQSTFHQLQQALRASCSPGPAPVAAPDTSPAAVSYPAAVRDTGSCQLQGNVDAECCNCTYAAVDDLNSRHVYPLVSEIVKTPFFKYFKVNIYCDCPLWPDDSMCSLRACSVCECEPGEVPAPWLAAERGLDGGRSCAKAADPNCNTANCAVEMSSKVDQSLEPGMETRLKHVQGWRGINNPWMAEGEDDEEYLYINLITNPERYTGYKGEHAHRIWDAIYNQSCFADGIDCREERVFYRLISGMHASISAHLVKDYLLDEERGLWGPNLEEFQQRLGTPEVRDRVENLYFAYLFVLRAVIKAGPWLAASDYGTDSPAEDAATKDMVARLVTAPAMRDSCPMPFDEGRLWRGEGGAALKAQLQATFQNITRVMDCVGCEKCKLWGKLQTLGVATALKVLFNSRGCDAIAGGGAAAAGAPAGGGGDAVGDDAPLQLERNEVIALVNLLARFSSSIQAYQELSAALLAQQGVERSLAARAVVA